MAVPLPGTVICELFGVPSVDHGRVLGWLRATRADLATEFETVESAAEELRDYPSSSGCGARIRVTT
ncbi:hypothetical protein [Nocardia miyunensis]|uniref:hypothetical protein n=1 Tax=Nocardia miyunensis TaxID=282684 RepID=UPI0012F4A442|nr:hypothetical protein [Nocardia miyunensis]